MQWLAQKISVVVARKFTSGKLEFKHGKINWCTGNFRCLEYSHKRYRCISMLSSLSSSCLWTATNKSPSTCCSAVFWCTFLQIGRWTVHWETNTHLIINFHSRIVRMLFLTFIRHPFLHSAISGTVASNSSLIIDRPFIDWSNAAKTKIDRTLNAKLSMLKYIFLIFFKTDTRLSSFKITRQMALTTYY